MIHRLIIITLLMGQISFCFGQISTKEAINMLKKDGLIVRVNCNGPKLDTLKMLSISANIDLEKQRKLHQRIQELETEYVRKTTLLMQAFDTYFDFCSVYFVPDSLFKSFVEGDREHIFLNKDLKLHSLPSRIPKQFIFASYPYARFRPLTLRQSKYIKEIADYARILPPFPEKTKSTDPLRIFRSQDKKEIIDLRKTISGLNEVLHHLYREVR